MHGRPAKRPFPPQRGGVLVVVLWLLALLSLMAASYSTTARTETRLTATQLQAAQARGLAEAGVWLGLQQLLQPAPSDGVKTQALSGIPLGAGVIDVQIQDEAGKIDLNTARPEILLGLVQSAGADPVDALAIRDAILDWRDRDNLRRAAGAEDADYRTKGLNDGAKDGPFNSIEELRAVMGMTEPVFQNMRPALTLYSHQPGIAGTVAVAQAVVAVPGATPEAVKSFLDQRAVATHGTPATSPSSGGLDSRYLAGRSSQTYCITSTGNVADTVVRLEVIVQLRPAAQPPFAILSWREAPWYDTVSDAATLEPDHG